MAAIKQISATEEHPGYLGMPVILALRPEIYLNGLLLDGAIVIAADSDRGTVTCVRRDKCGNVMHRDGVILTETKCGNVCIWINEASNAQAAH